MDTNTGTKTGRSETLLLRVPPKLKERLKAAADESGRTMTSEAQYRLDRSLDSDQGRGGPQIAAMLDYMGSIAALIQSGPMTEEEDELIRYWALEGAFIKAIQRWLPRPSKVPDFGMRDVNRLHEALPDLEREAVTARLEQGASPPSDGTPKPRRPGLFGSSMPIPFEPEVEFPAVPHTRALTSKSFERLIEWRNKSKGEPGQSKIGLLGNYQAAPIHEREPSITVKKTEGGLVVMGGAEDALHQEKQLELRHGEITAAELEWARAYDELAVRGPEFLEEVEKHKAEAERLAETAFARIETRYDLPHDELLEAISAEAEHRGIKAP